MLLVFRETKRWLSWAVLWTVVRCLTVATVFAHGGVHERIDAVNRKIANDPGNAKLYLDRGELHASHGDFQSAYADYQLAKTLAPKLSEVDLYVGMLFAKKEEWQRAETNLSRFIKKQPKHAKARIERAAVYFKLNKTPQAVDDLSSAIVLGVASPKLYVQRAEWVASLGPQSFDRALAGIDDGLKALGPVVSLMRFAIDLERKRGNYKKALERVQSLPQKMRTSPHGLVLKGDLLLESQKRQDAIMAYQSALAALEALPAARKRAPAMAELRAELLRKLKSAKKSP
ncbi:MAG: tetratricopeptide repeat protein [Myxococcales bacterium]|nr:MAG: tetratricopeptide repeat protein [Myxococcales bacterium]